MIRSIALRSPAAVAAACAALAVASPALAQEPVPAGRLLADPAFKSAYFSALGPRAKERWLARLDMSSPLATVTVGGEPWQMATPCKPRDCGDNNLLLLWSPTRRVVHGKLMERGRGTLIGAPDAAMAGELERLWQKEFRQR